MAMTASRDAIIARAVVKASLDLYDDQVFYDMAVTDNAKAEAAVRVEISEAILDGLCGLYKDCPSAADIAPLTTDGLVIRAHIIGRKR